MYFLLKKIKLYSNQLLSHFFKLTFFNLEFFSQCVYIINISKNTTAMTKTQKFKVSSIIREIFGDYEVSFQEHPRLNSAFIATKHVMCRYSNYKLLEHRMRRCGFEIFEITGSPMPAKNNYISYQIDFTPCH